MLKPNKARKALSNISHKRNQREKLLIRRVKRSKNVYDHNITCLSLLYNEIDSTQENNRKYFVGSLTL